MLSALSRPVFSFKYNHVLVGGVVSYGSLGGQRLCCVAPWWCWSVMLIGVSGGLWFMFCLKKRKDTKYLQF